MSWAALAAGDAASGAEEPAAKVRVISSSSVDTKVEDLQSKLLLKVVSVGFALTALVPSALSAVDPYAAREVGSG